MLESQPGLFIIEFPPVDAVATSTVPPHNVPCRERAMVVGSGGGGEEEEEEEDG